MSFIKTVALTCLAMSSLVAGHMEMKKPIPIASKFDPVNTGGAVDYDMMRPLSPSGSDYPCLGHHTSSASHTTATYAAGGTYDLELAGSAVHGGGSCQISLSYDNGASFRVIKSIIGNCPLQPNYKFTIPSTMTPAKDALLAWSWFNKLGNREMYMNCARVEITGGRSSRDGSLAEFPAIFRANTFGNGQCVVPDGTEVVFANPGPEVEFGNPALKGMLLTNIAGCPASSAGTVEPPKYDNLNDTVEEPTPEADAEEPAPVADAEEPTPEADAEEQTSEADVEEPTPEPDNTYIDGNADNDSELAGPPDATASAPSSSSDSGTTATISFDTLFPTASGFLTVTRSSSAPASAPTSPAPASPGMCSEQTILCSESGSEWLLCAHGSYLPMGRVAEGTICRNGEIARDTGLGECDDVGDETTMCLREGNGWAMCVSGSWVDMGQTAEGTRCAEGRIVAGK